MLTTVPARGAGVFGGEVSAVLAPLLAPSAGPALDGSRHEIVFASSADLEYPFDLDGEIEG